MQELVQATALVALAPFAALAAAAWMQAAGGGLVSPSVALAVAAVGSVLGAIVGARAVRQH